MESPTTARGSEERDVRGLKRWQVADLQCGLLAGDVASEQQPDRRLGLRACTEGIGICARVVTLLAFNL